LKAFLTDTAAALLVSGCLGEHRQTISLQHAVSDSFRVTYKCDDKSCCNRPRTPRVYIKLPHPCHYCSLDDHILHHSNMAFRSGAFQARETFNDTACVIERTIAYSRKYESTPDFSARVQSALGTKAQAMPCGQD
jgi:hypothetical protein